MDESLSIDPCNLCPRTCGAHRLSGERGICGANAEMHVARAALHFWEEPPLSGERGSGTVFFSGCPLHCVYCQNYEISTSDAGEPVNVSKLAKICLDLEGQGALNVNFVTPTHHSIEIAEAVSCARAQGLSIPVVWNTSGYERVEVVDRLRGTVDVYLADYKYVDAGIAKRYSHAPDYPDVALEAIAAMVEAVGKPSFDEVDGSPRMIRGVVVRHLALPGHIEQSRRAVERLFERFGNDVLYSIMNQYTPIISGDNLARFPELGSRVPDEEYEALLDFADAIGIDDYFWQEGPAAKESFIPAWDGTGVL